jgi:glycosyltransferase involved in cell wall biosynthesis
VLHRPVNRVRRVLITLDAVGGVWRYALDVARGLETHGVSCLLVGFGPEPDAACRAECAEREMVWTGEPLDWMVSDGAALRAGTAKLGELATGWNADLLHLNLPSQAVGLSTDRPVAVASHSCVPTWWQAVQGSPLPASLAWQLQCNRDGFQRADAILVPSESHGAALRQVYGALPPLCVVHNATSVEPSDAIKDEMILAVGRWWDAGKNGGVLDSAAVAAGWPLVVVGPLSGPDGQQAAFRHARALGSLPHDAVLALMRRAAIFAAPSRYEPFGLAVAEAAVSGAVLVLSDIPTFRELWDGAAVFVAADDVDGWSHAFATLAGDPALRQRLAQAARVRARRFSLARQAVGLIDVYTKVSTPVLVP